MSVIIHILICYTYHTVSTPFAYYTLSNPAFTAYRGEYQVIIEPRAIGDIAVFNCAVHFRTIGFGLSNLRASNENKNWLSIAYHNQNKLPLSSGINLGISENTYNSEKNLLCDLGLWSRTKLESGINFSNILNDNRAIRIGLSYPISRFKVNLELEDSLALQRLIPHFFLNYTQPLAKFTLQIGIGYKPEKFCGVFSAQYQDFIKCQYLIAQDQKLTFEISFSPPVIYKEITVIETLFVEQPIVIKKITKLKPTNKKSQEKSPTVLSEKEKTYCDEHYLKGIEYYLNNELKRAIEEWEKVYKVAPNFKDLKRYLENARAKLKLLNE